ncbi:hypothetical protein ABPG75_011149 [Micractinium tetrahymenae]
MSSRSAAVREEAAIVLCLLAMYGANACQAVVATGAVAPLLQLLRQANMQATTSSGSSSSSSSSDASDGRGDSRVSEGLKWWVARAMHSIANHSRQGREAIATAGGIVQLVGLLADTNMSVSAAAGVLAALAGGSPAHRQAVEAAGGIAALKHQLHGIAFSPSNAGSPAVCRALSALARGGAASCAEVATPHDDLRDGDGVGRLLFLLRTGYVDRPTQAAVAETLATLAAYGSEELRAAVAQRAAALPAKPAALLSSALAAVQAVRVARVCAAEGCGAARGLKRCGGCGTVRWAPGLTNAPGASCFTGRPGWI